MSDGCVETKLENYLNGCSNGKGEGAPRWSPLDAERGDRERELKTVVCV